jgi:hypothetical protein
MYYESIYFVKSKEQDLLRAERQAELERKAKKHNN